MGKFLGNKITTCKGTKDELLNWITLKQLNNFKN